MRQAAVSFVVSVSMNAGDSRETDFCEIPYLWFFPIIYEDLRTFLKIGQKYQTLMLCAFVVCRRDKSLQPREAVFSVRYAQIPQETLGQTDMAATPTDMQCVMIYTKGEEA
jgi:hypothetical protein